MKAFGKIFAIVITAVDSFQSRLEMMRERGRGRLLV